MTRLMAGLLLVALALPVQAAALEELQLAAAIPVEGMPAGNLSGLAQCGSELLALTDRDDDRIFRLQRSGDHFVATPQLFSIAAPELPPLPMTLSMAAGVMGALRGGSQYDFEGLECDAAGNRYLVSETFARVLKLTPSGDASWLMLPDSLYRAATSAGLLQNVNAVIEGLAISPDGRQLWLAAEREARGLIHAELADGQWQCAQPCITQVEHREVLVSAEGKSLSLDFAGLTLYQGQLFSLDRIERRICRRDPQSGQVSRCWSFDQASEQPSTAYPAHASIAEALWMDAQGAWVGLDNGGRVTVSGETRSLIMQLQAPVAGWLAP